LDDSFLHFELPFQQFVFALKGSHVTFGILKFLLAGLQRDELVKADAQQRQRLWVFSAACNATR
jgi:hypothetical protein